MTNDDPHADIEFDCVDGIDGGGCGATVSYPDDYVTIRSTPLDYGMFRGLLFRCSECGARHYQCPVCAGTDGPSGWFRGESTGEMLACHNCNEEERYEQERRGY